jgi:hypothetical protein
VGLDVGDRQSHYCVLDLDGGVVAEGALKTTEASLRVVFEGKARMRIALEAGTHSPWISRLLIALGHDPRPGLDGHLAGADHRQVDLRLGRSGAHGREERRPDVREPRARRCCP